MWTKHKRIILIVLAVVFLVVLFLIKTTSLFQDKETYQLAKQENGLTYDTANLTVADLVNKDTDGDGVPDWQESLYGLDPTKAETTPGIPDSSAINNAKTHNASGQKTTVDIKTPEKLTQTDQFSRELFATVAAASQNGTMDQASVDQLSSSLADRIQNTPPRKVFSVFEIKTTSDDSTPAFKTYNNALTSMYNKYPQVSYTVLDVLQKFMPDDSTVNSSALVQLDPIIIQINHIIDTMVKTTVPQSISTLHLNVINSLERLSENLSDIQQYATDSLVALGGISKYQDDMTTLNSDLNTLANAINQNLSQR